jgi:CHAT domain-containing protein/tetratricopeptide (TPR) repeat protein
MATVFVALIASAMVTGAVAPLTRDATEIAALRQKLAARELEPVIVGAGELLQALHDTGEGNGPVAADLIDLLVEATWRSGALRADTRGLAERAVEIREGGDDPSDLAVSLGNLGVVLELEGEFDRARTLYERTLEIQRATSGSNPLEVATSLTNLGILARVTGRYAESRDHFEEAAAIRESTLGPNEPVLGFSLHNLASVLFDMGDYAAARRAAERAVAILESAGAEHRLRLADAVEALGVIRQNTGSYPVARKHFERALALRAEIAGGDDALLVFSLVNLGSVAIELGDVDAAIEYAKRALRIAEKTDVGRWQLGLIYSNMAIATARRSGYDAAAEWFARGVDFWEDAFGSDDPRLAGLRETQARFLISERRYSHARDLLATTLATHESALGAQNPLLGKLRAGLAWALLGERRYTDAFDIALRASVAEHRHARLMARGLPERQALRYLSIRPKLHDLLAYLAVVSKADADRVGQAWDAVVRSRALVFDELAARYRVTREDSEASGLIANLAAARERLAHLVVRVDGSEDEAQRTAFARARDEKESLERHLADLSLPFRDVQDRARLGFAEVRRALPAGAALVAYLRAETTYPSHRPPISGAATPNAIYLAFVLPSGDSEPIVLNLGDSEPIDALVQRWRARIRQEATRLSASMRTEVATARVGASLRRAIWDPVRDVLGSPDRIFVVPDAQLHLLNLSALPLPDGRYMIEALPVFTLSHERDLVPPATISAGAELLAIGDPAFGAAANARVGAQRPSRSAVCAPLADMTFAPLPDSGLELDAIVDAWRSPSRPVRQLRHTFATESAFKQRGPGSRVVHIATHGFFRGDDCFAPMDSESSALADSPLLRSGLAFAGANDRAALPLGADDGILTAEEIVSMDLRGTEWSVLSACETGLGEILAGEGVFGLQRAFQLAGVRTIIMSLWPVGDATTARFMERLYLNRFSMGQSTAAAIHSATLAELALRRRGEDGAHPFYWAPFVATGDWR